MSETLLIIDDEELICWSVKKEFEKNGMEVFTASNGADGLRSFIENHPDIVLLDVKLPDRNGIDLLNEIKKLNQDAIVIIITSFGGVESAVAAIKDGAYDYIEKPFQLENIKITINRAVETIRLKKEVRDLRNKDGRNYSFDNFRTQSAGMKEVISLARKVAAIDYTTVLLQGESGTGKDFMAKIIHNESCRAAKPFVEISCSMLPDTLIESELFGYEKGAFTDAKNAKRGLFEMAQGGTIYMDEIGDVKLPTQVKLLRFLEEKTFKRVGGSKDISIDVRIIAATNKNLEKEVEAGNFRQDLFYRLKVLPIHIPPLRERREDIIPLAWDFISQFNIKFKKQVTALSPSAETLLSRYDWPGNVRELRNVIEHIMILTDTDSVLPDNIPQEIRSSRKTKKDGDDIHSKGEILITVPEGGVDLPQIEKEYIRQALLTAEGNQTKAAMLLNVSRDVLRYRMQKLDL
jgi:two-component system response regulator AtoC